MAKARHPRKAVIARKDAARVLDRDLDVFSRKDLIAEVKKLRNGIRVHRDANGHELCWHHPQLWGLLPEKTDPLPIVPSWPRFLEGCLRYRQSLDVQVPEAPRRNIRYPARPDEKTP